LKERGILDETEYGLSLLEPLPEAPVPLPDERPSPARTVGGRRSGNAYHDLRQPDVATPDTGDRQPLRRDYASNHIHNLAALIADAETGEVLAYAERHFTPTPQRNQ